MATKKYLTLAGLTTYDTEIKEVISAGDAAALASAKSYTDQKLTGLTGGTIVVKEAEHATKADSATSADSVAWGNVTGKPSTFTPASHNHDDRYYTESEVDSNISTAVSGLASTSSVNIAVSNHNGSTSAHSDIRAAIDAVKEDIDTFFADADFTTNAKDTLKEIQTYIDSDAEAASEMLASINGKADKATTLAGYGITNAYTKTEVDTALSGKAASSHGTHVTFDSTNKPKMDGTAAFGTSTKVARADHVHPTDTSRASQADLDALTTTVNGKAASGHGHDVATTSAAGFMSADMVTKLNGIATGANKTTVDSSMSNTSTNPVQNKIVYSELAKKATTIALDSVSSVANEAKTAAATNTQAISANTSSISGHTTRISNLETKVGDGFEEITTAEIQALFA